MKEICIDGTTISLEMDGLSQYILNVVEQFAIHYSKAAHFTLLIRKGECPQSYLETYRKAGIQIEIVDVAPIGPKRDLAFEKYLKKHLSRFDVFYEPSNQYPRSLKNGVYTIHDLTYETFPEQLGKLSWLKRIILHYNVRIGLRRSRKIIAISNFTKLEILRLYKLKDLNKKIEVVYEGWEHLGRKESVSIIEGIPSKYYFYVGSSRGHKNLCRLLSAFQKIVELIDVDLVISGNMDRLGFIEKEIIAEVNFKRKRIYCTGWLSDADLSYYFSHSFAFVFPSLSEGFGIPVLESFYYGIPLLCSNNTVFPEVAGKAALYFNPFDVEDIARCLFEFYLNSDKIAPVLVQEGKDRLNHFSWKQAADKIMDILIND